ncbi:MAG: hypothetical protein GQ570_15090 [Helicobacteraceae bacterium]|nr:hypothetical protein [Helicobacteraceae bacterium]
MKYIISILFASSLLFAVKVGDIFSEDEIIELQEQGYDRKAIGKLASIKHRSHKKSTSPLLKEANNLQDICLSVNISSYKKQQLDSCFSIDAKVPAAIAKDTLLRLLSSKSIEEISTTKGKAKLKAQIRNSLKLDTNIYITHFLIVKSISEEIREAVNEELDRRGIK